MEQDEDIVLDENFKLFSRPPTKNPKPLKDYKSKSTVVLKSDDFDSEPQIEKSTNPNPGPDTTIFEDLGLADWASRTCKELGMKKPTAVQSHCIPKILAGKDVLGLAQTGSGKMASFALPILHRLAEDPFGVFALVVTLNACDPWLVYKARHVAKMKMMDDGFEDIVKERKKQKLRTLSENGLLKKRKRKRGAKESAE